MAHSCAPSPLDLPPHRAAQVAGLHYVCDRQPGIRRQKWGRGFTYYDVNGERITDPDPRDRIRALKIPPAWTQVWICPSPLGHLQATGRDAKGRKQYRYHQHWRRIRTQAKFDRVVIFGERLPRLRQQVQRDLTQPRLSRVQVIATVVHLLEITLIRIGNEAYAQTNQSFGLTTLRDRHLALAQSAIRFQFCGKSGVEHDIEIQDAALAKILRHCQELPGHVLFQYRDAQGQCQRVESGDVNAYLQQVMGEGFSAKDFRTWFGTVRAVEALWEQEDCGTAKTADDRDQRIRIAIQQTAQQLGNRPATCKKYYIHPEIWNLYRQGTLLRVLDQFLSDSSSGLSPCEQAIITLLSPRSSSTALSVSNEQCNPQAA
ncbi:DNA topoisomerase IB [Lyngbya confervoides]|uniref:DNA topoisomerase n=1 Tax=Lyngbya confervoides BDU141951 TaxID=1574623 RepID=A0ABD4SZA9_9CYAN|nr:DNA topoisomerase IB [Lyngbya confervoides]MCM1981708.1 hypothetical protein [Lyngbya confervoides BDU141951]